MGVRLLLTANGCGTKRKEDTTMKISRIKELKNFCLAATILVAGASLAACSSSDDSINENQQPVTPIKPQVYTMTVKATKGSDAADTRGLYTSTTEGKTSLNVKWNEGEVVKVYQGDAEIGELTAAASATASTTLTGSFDSAPSTSAALTFYFHTNATPSYSGQDGTLETIASTYDFCALATVTTGNFDVDDKNKKITVSGGVNFGTNQQAIIKFTLLDKTKVDDVAIKPTTLTVSDGTSTVELTQIPDATYTTNGNGVLYVAFPAAGSAKTVTLTATVDNDTYTYEKSGVTFTNGQYYEINVKMYKYIATGKNVSNEDMNVPTGEHWYITGTSNTNKITIADGAALTLDNVNISSESYCIKCEGDATIILKDGSTNTLTCSDFLSTTNLNTNPALWAGGSGKTLTIKGTGSIVAKGGDYAAGIGSGNGGTCGNITITGGTITAEGGANAAGIGSGGGGTCGTITITGGTITATGGSWAAGIGSGSPGTCVAITIASTVSSVTATRGSFDKDAPNSIGAGAGEGASCGTVTIDDVSGATSSSTFSHFDSVVSDDGNTWTLTHKNP